MPFTKHHLMAYLFHHEVNKALWYPVLVYMYLMDGITHFYHLALCNLVLGLMNILLKSKLFRWWMSYGDMTVYGHATIIEVLLGQIIYKYPNHVTSYYVQPCVYV